MPLPVIAASLRHASGAWPRHRTEDKAIRLRPRRIAVQQRRIAPQPSGKHTPGTVASASCKTAAHSVPSRAAREARR